MDSRRATVRFYSGAPIYRNSPALGEYELRFGLDPSAADFSRLNAGAAVTRDHSRALADQVGVVEKAWIKDGAAYATVRLSQRDGVADIWRDISDGVLKAVSMEVSISNMEPVTRRGDALPSYVATRWQPVALSLVSVPADAGAAFTLSLGETTRVVSALSFTQERNTMDLDHNDPTPKTEEKLAEHPREPVALSRLAEIQRVAQAFGLDDVWAQRTIASGAPTEDVITLAADERAKRQPRMINDIGFGLDHDAPGSRLERMALGLAARITKKEPEDAGREYAHARFAELAYECLDMRGLGRGLDPRVHGARIIQEALAHTTSDFPMLLGSAMNKVLLPAYENAAPTFQKIAGRGDFNDFKPQKIMRRGDFPSPLKVAEAGEITMGTMSEKEESATLATFGRIFQITRQAIVNDDLAAFSNLATDAALRVADVHNQVFYQTCILPNAGLGPALADAVTMFHANHGNIAATGALSVTTLSSAREKMMTQTSLDGLKLNLSPAFLLVSPASQTLAEQLVATIAPAQTSNVNPFAGKLEVLADANLTGTRFYLFASPERLAACMYGFLEGGGPLRFETKVDFATEATLFKVATDFGVAAIEHRAAVTGAGA